MRVVVTSGKRALDESLREYVEQRLRFALGRFAREIPRVSARISDVNGPRGGRDTRVRIDASVRGAEDVHVSCTREDAYRATAFAAERAGRAVQRRQDRRRTRKRSAHGPRAEP